MPRPDEITSTDKLLDLIRTKPGKGTTEAPDSLEKNKFDMPHPKGDGIKLSVTKILPAQRSLTIGVDIGHDFLRLVKMTKVTEPLPKVIEIKALPLPPRAIKGSPELESFLRDEITAFCGSTKKLQIWALMSAAHVDVRHLRIPKVAKKQITNTVYWSVKREMALDERENIFDFVIQGEVVDQGISKLAVMYYTVSRQEVEDMKRLFTRIGLPLAGISISPFAMQNIFRHAWIPNGGGTVAHLFIGNDFSRIDIYAHGFLAMTRGIKAGTNSMVESLMADFNDSRIGLPHISGSAQPIDADQARRIITSLCPDSSPLAEGDTGFGLTEEEIFEMIRPALERLTKQVERTFEHYAVSPGSERVDRLFITSALKVCQPIVDYVGDQLGTARDILDPLSPDLPGIMGKDFVKSINISERTAFGPALGLAMSDDAMTPNFLFTFKDKEEKANVRRINQVIFSLFVATVVACSGIFIYEISTASQKKAELANLEKKLAQFSPRVDQNMIMTAFARNSQQRQTAKAYSDRYVGMALIGEIADLTPRDISLINIAASLGGLGNAGQGQERKDGKSQAQASKTGAETILIEGMILGERSGLESILAGYVMKLEASPMFQSVKVAKHNFESLKKKQVLHFTVEAKLG